MPKRRRFGFAPEEFRRRLDGQVSDWWRVFEQISAQTVRDVEAARGSPGEQAWRRVTSPEALRDLHADLDRLDWPTLGGHRLVLLLVSGYAIECGLGRVVGFLDPLRVNPPGLHERAGRILSALLFESCEA